MEIRSVKAGLLLLLAMHLGGCAAVRHQFRHLLGDRQVRLADDVTIERDEWGVPHIHGRSDAAAAFGVAWAMAEDNYWQVEESYLQDLGLSAYYYGVRYLADDLVRVAFEVEAHARAEYEAAPASVQELLTGYAEGLNYYLRQHRDAPRRVIGRYEPWMVLARAQRVSAGQSVAGVRLADLAVLVGAADAGWRAPSPAGRGAAVAVGPAQSVTGRALLLASVHAPFFGGEQAYEVEVESASGWHVYGFARLGTPVPHTGHNERLAWAHAWLSPDSGTVTRLIFANADDSLAFRVGDTWERAEPWSDTVAVNTAAGVESRVYRFLRTPYGPVLTRRGDTAWAVQLPRLREGGSLQQWYRMGIAQSAAEFAAALGEGALPGAATVYADGEGNILRHSGGPDPPELNPAGGVVAAGSDLGSLAAAAPDSGWSVGWLERLALGVSAAAVDADIAQLVNEWEHVGGRESRRAFAMDTVIERLRRWDGRTNPSATEPTLYHFWRSEYQTEERDKEQGGSPPAQAGVAADPFPRFRALERARARLLEEWGTDSVPWSEVNRLQRRHTSGEEVFRDEESSLGVSGLPDGSLFVLQTVRGTGRRGYAVSGTAAVLLAELTTPPGVRSVVVFGQSAGATSPHHFDQAAKYAAGELKPAWFGAAARGAQIRERYHPGERARVLQGETSTH